MILKIEIEENAGRFKLIDEIKEFDYKYVSMKDYEGTLDELIGRTTKNGLISSYVDKDKMGNFVLLSFIDGSEQSDGYEMRYILSNMSVYVLNENGDTIEKIRY